MRKILLFAFLLCMMNMTIIAAPFTPGNIVVYRVGTGSSFLSSGGFPAFLDEYTPAGVLVQTIALPTTASGNNYPIFLNGTSSSEGLMTLSADGNYLMITGYASNAAGVSSATAASVNRIIGRIDGNGNINTTTALTDAYDGSNIRSVVSTDGNDIWMGGTAGSGLQSTAGVRYTTLGSTTSTQLSSSVSNVRQVNIFNGQLYVSTSSGTAFRLATVGTGTPTTTGQTLATLPGLPTSGGSPYNFFFADVDAGVAGPDVLYIADDAGGVGTYGSIHKYSLVAGSWVANDSILAPGVRGIIGKVTGTSVQIYATSGGSTSAGGAALYSYNDVTGYNVSAFGSGSTAPSATALVSLLAANNPKKSFRGIAFAPAGGTTAVTASEALNESFKIYPNPSTGRVSLESLYGEAADIVVYNTMGVEMFTTTLQYMSTIQFGLEQKGVYTVKISTGNQMVVKKIIIE